MMISTRRQFSPHRTMRGMGATGSQIIGVTGNVAGSTAAALTPLLFGAAAGPIGLAIGGAVTAVTTVLAALGIGSGCGQSCIQASQTANQVEQAMKANLAAFLAGQIDRATALANFDALWGQAVQIWQQIGGGAGTNGVADREQGACKWKDSAGQCWNWFIGYRDPIANAAPSTVESVTSKLGSISLREWLLIGAAGALVAGNL